jgi:hypothetical protein
VLEHLAAFPWCDTRDHIRAIVHALPSVKCAGAAGDALHDKPRVFINQDGHDWNDE